MSFDTVSALHARLEDESPFPYFVDVVDAEHLTDDTLKKRIELEGKTILP